MTHDELLAKAIEHLRAVESRRKNTPERLATVTVDLLPRRRVRDAVVVYLESDSPDGGHIQAVLDRESGDMLAATYSPPKSDLRDNTI